MNDMKCFGYYIIKPILKPEWCTLKASHILSVGLSETFPNLEKCFWINYPKSNRTEYQRYLQLNDNDFSDFCELVADLFDNKRLTADARFYFLDDVMKIYQYLRNVNGYRIIGIFTDSEIFDNEGIFDVVKAVIKCSKPGKAIGCDILGCENLRKGYFSYIINSLNEVLEQQTDNSLIIDSQTGLIQNTYEETKQYCSFIQGKGEPVIWTPYDVHEFFI